MSHFSYSLSRKKTLVLLGVVFSAAIFFAGIKYASLRKQGQAIEEDINKQCPLEKQTSGSMPPSGVRHWSSSFRRLRATGAYVSYVSKEDGVELWKANNVRRGQSLETLGPWEKAFENDIINDVFTPEKPDELAPERFFARSQIIYDPEIGYIMLGCVCPVYQPGSVSLLPAIVISKTGKQGTWIYKGKLKGEIEEKAFGKKIWSDGGSIIRLRNNTWRIYLNGYDKRLAAIEAPTLEGPWKFLRDNKGDIRELLQENDPKVGSVFPQVLRLSENEWHCWITDKWPPQSIYHYVSSDGLSWKRYGEQPEITRACVGGRPIKCIRVHYDEAKHELVGILSVWGELPSDELTAWENFLKIMGLSKLYQWWELYECRMELPRQSLYSQP